MSKPPDDPEDSDENERGLVEGHRSGRGLKFEAYEGPFAPPGFMKEVDAVVPGAAARIIKLTEDEAEHRRMLERRRQLFPFLINMFARVVALAFAAGCLYVIAYGMDKGQWVSASVLSGAVIVAGVHAFLRRR